MPNDARASQKLTERVIKALPAADPDTEYFAWDSVIRGLGVRVRPSGGKVYTFKYRPRGSRGTKRVTLGAVGVLTVDSARREARKLAGSVAGGGDPAKERRARREVDTVKSAGVKWFAHLAQRVKTGKMSADTVYEYERQWKVNILPHIGTRKVTDITFSDVERLHAKLFDGKDESTRPIEANKTITRLHTFFEWCAKRGMRARGDNPARGIERNPEEKRERFLSPAEFAKLGTALAKAEREGIAPAPRLKKKPKDPNNPKVKHRAPSTWGKVFPADPFAVAAIRLLMLTGMRRGEVLSLRWDAVDWERGHIRLATSKTGKSVRPLGAAARELLSSLPRIEGNPHVFPGAKPGSHLATVGRLWESVKTSAGLDDVRLHDLRHSVASALAIGGGSLLVIGAVLGHKDTRSTSRYAHLSDNPVKDAADRVSGEIAAWMSSAETPVTPIKKKAKAR